MLEKYRFNTKPSLRIIILAILGMILFSWIIYVMTLTKVNAAKETDVFVTRSILMLFIFFDFGALMLLLTVKSFALTKTELIIRRPLLFFERKVLLTDIELITESNFKIEATTRGNPINIHNGLKALVTLNNGKTIKLNTFETGNYKNLIHEIKVNVAFKKHNL